MNTTKLINNHRTQRNKSSNDYKDVFKREVLGVSLIENVYTDSPQSVCTTYIDMFWKDYPTETESGGRNV